MVKFISMGLLLLLVSLPIQAQQGIRAVLGEDSLRFSYVTEAWGQEIGSLDVEVGVLATNTDTECRSETIRWWSRVLYEYQ